MEKLLRMIDCLSIFFGKAGSFLIPLVAGFVIYEVFMRYFLRLPTLWVSESIAMGCLIFYFLSSAWVLQAGRHAKIEALYDRVSIRRRAILDVGTFFFFALYVVVMFYAGAVFFWDSLKVQETSGSPWNPSIYPLKFVIILGFFLLFLQGMAKLIRDLRFLLKGDPNAPKH